MTALGSTAGARARLAALLAPAVLTALEELIRAEVDARLLAARSSAEGTLVRADLAGLGSTPRDSARKVRRLVAAGRLVASKIGRHLFVRSADLAAFCAANQARPASPARAQQAPIADRNVKPANDAGPPTTAAGVLAALAAGSDRTPARKRRRS